jgi:hypothetical protein
MKRKLFLAACIVVAMGILYLLDTLFCTLGTM